MIYINCAVNCKNAVYSIELTRYIVEVKNKVLDPPISLLVFSYICIVVI